MHGRQALHRAAGFGQVDTMLLLISRGARMDARDKQGFQAIHVAAQAGHVGALQLLIERGADVHAAESAGNQPLHLAAKGHLEAARLLLDKGASVHATVATGMWQAHHTAAMDGNVAMLQLLLDRGADPTAVCIEPKGVTGRVTTAHLIAIEHGRMDVLKVLIDRTSGSVVRGDDGVSLERAFAKGCVRAAVMIAKAGGQLPARDGPVVELLLAREEERQKKTMDLGLKAMILGAAGEMSRLEGSRDAAAEEEARLQVLQEDVEEQQRRLRQEQRELKRQREVLAGEWRRLQEQQCRLLRVKLQGQQMEAAEQEVSEGKKRRVA